MIAESVIFFALWNTGTGKRDRFGSDEDTQQKNRKKQAHSKRTAKGVVGGVKGRNFAKRVGGGQNAQMGGAILGAGFSGMKGERKGEKKAAEDEAKGKKPEGRTKSLAKEGAKEAAKYAFDQGARKVLLNPEAIAASWGTSAIAYYGVKHWKIALTLILCLFLLVFMLFDAASFQPPMTQNQGPDTPTTSDTCVPAQINDGQISVCTITVTYPGSAQDIAITDTILFGTEYVSSTHNGTFTPPQIFAGKGIGITNPGTVTWDAAKLNLPLDPVNIMVSVTVRATQNNERVYNAYAITPTGLTAANGGGAGVVPGNLPPSTNNCSGVYSAYMAATPGHQNYGDPTCALVEKDPNGNAIINKDLILKELQTIKPSEAMGWFVCVVPNESGYNANAYLAASTSGFGAYGLVQMNPTGHGNDKYDNGEVVWDLQLSNGINYNDATGHNFAYWPTSYDQCLRDHGVTVN